MNASRPRRLAAVIITVLLGAGLGIGLGLRFFPATATPAAGEALPDAASPGGSSAAAPAAVAPDESSLLADAAGANEAARVALASRLRALLNRQGVRPDQAVFVFKDAEGYRRFLERARAAGLEVSGRIDALLTVRLQVGDYDALVRELAGHVGDYAAISANPILSGVPPAEDRAARLAEPVGANLLAALGLAPGTDTSAWGRGVLVAILDGGAAADPAFAPRLRYLDIGYGLTGPDDAGRHGTAVASLVGGAAPDAAGVAPSSSLLSIRVTGADGNSDAFSVAQGILGALGAGAQVINISLGGYASSPVLAAAIEEAISAGAAVVASGGNDQATKLMWPAAYEGVVSVGATDAGGRQAIFSNSGSSLQLTAPGYAIQAAGLDGERTLFSGTSASAPVVSGAIAAILSTTPGLTAIEAADILAGHSNDGGAPGADPDYGRGTLNLDWALDRANPLRIDPALSSHSYSPASSTLLVVVQNRGSRPVYGLSVSVSIGGVSSTHPVPALAPAASAGVQVPVNASQLATAGRLVADSRLVLPAGLNDQNPANNRRVSLILHSAP
jgi:hypothetical protein